jgi:hypothetical protein
MFFIGYFLSIDLGEKRHPRDSAVYFVMVHSLGLGISVLFLLKFLGASYNNGVAILSVAGIVAVLAYSVFTKSFVNRRLPEFSYLGEAEYKSRRKLIGVVSLIAFLALTIGTALINNERVKNFLIG